jgi:hypothetical protein
MWYNKALNCYYVDEKAIPLHVRYHPNLVELVSKSDAITLIKEAFFEGTLEGYHCGDYKIAVEVFLEEKGLNDDL